MKEKIVLISQCIECREFVGGIFSIELHPDISVAMTIDKLRHGMISLHKCIEVPKFEHQAPILEKEYKELHKNKSFNALELLA